MSNMERERQQGFVMSLDGLEYSTARYWQAIRDASSRRGSTGVQSSFLRKRSAMMVIFTDNTTFQLESHWRKCFHKKMPRKLKFNRKHPPKMYVWAGISKRGATKIVLFSKIMTATRYFDIRLATIVPLLKEKYPHGHHMYQENNPKHTSKYIQCFLLQMKYSGRRVQLCPQT